MRAGGQLLYALDQVGRQLVGLAARGAVADGDQVDTVGRGQPAQRVDRAVPVLARLVWVDRGRVEHLAGVADHRHLHAGADAGVQAHHHALAGRRGQQQVAQVLGEHLDRHLLGVLSQPCEQVALQAQAELDLPGPGHALADQLVGRALGVAPAQVHSDAAFGERGPARHHLLVEHQLRVQDLQRPTAEHRERAVRGHGAERLVVVEVVAELRDLRVLLVLAVHQLGAQQALVPQPAPQRLHQCRVLGPAFGQQVAHAVEHRVGIGEAGGRQRLGAARIAGHEGGGLDQRVERGVGEQAVGQRLDAGLAGDHALGAAPRLEGQVEVFQLLLGRRRLDRRPQIGRELALLVDALQHGGAALLELAQVTQPRFQIAQLGVIEVVGRLLAVARDEGHRGPAVEQFDGSVDLGRPNLQLGGDLQQDLVHGLGRGPATGRGSSGRRAV